jgi:hypothetical protein
LGLGLGLCRDRAMSVDLGQALNQALSPDLSLVQALSLYRFFWFF